MPAEAKAFKKKFGVTYREIRGYNYLKKFYIKRIFIKTKTFKKKFGITYREIRGHNYLKKFCVKRIPAEKRIRLKRSYEITY